MPRIFYEKRWFFIAMALFGVLLALPAPMGLSSEGHVVLCVALAATVLFITEPVPLPTVALLIVLAQVLLLGIDSSVVAKSLMNDSVLFIMGSLMLAVALVKQQLDKRLALAIVRVTGTRTTRIALGISVVSGILASFIGEHTVAAMMLPVALSLINLAATGDDGEKGPLPKNLAVLLLFSISYACAMAGIGSPSGGARNAIMIDYLGKFFTGPQYQISYADWMLYCYPLFLVQLPFMHVILARTFPPEHTDLSGPVASLTEQVGKQGRMQARQWTAIVFFVAVLVGWVLLSSQLGMGTIAIAGAALFLASGLVRWSDINTGVNWGVVLLYAAAISLGVQMKETGAASWVAESFLTVLSPLGMGSGLGLVAAVVALTALITNTMSNGAAVAVLGPVVLNMAASSGSSPLVIGFATAVASAFAYLTVIGTPASTIVHSSGMLTSADFFRAGSRMILMSFVFVLLAAWLYWPLLGTIMG